MNFLDLMQYQFFQNAVLASVLASILCGIVGTYIVARRIVFISGGITHASFGGIGMAYYFGFNPLLGAAIFAIFSALGIEFMSKKIEIREDSAIGILWSLGMAVGIIFIFLSPGYAPNLMTSLFGSILNVGRLELILMLILSVILIVVFYFLYRPILAVAFDEEYARSQRIPVAAINYMMIVLLSLVIVMNIRVVGIILVLSLLTIPQSAANIFTRHFGRMMGLSVLFSFIGCLSGLLLSFYGDLPSGASIIFSLVILFILAKLFQFIFQRLK
ncbi:MAG: metal ABC transporter permease [Bacteroidales bacterium]|jgi:zinc transport system permease protein|nr:metal ABC transporter permease [Bacteroidales bacterium]